MARLLGPDANSRLVYLVQGTSLLSTVGATAIIYSDAAATVRADIAVYDGTGSPGATITNSTVTVDSTSQLPRFWFPADGTDTLYCRVNNGPAAPINADYNARIETLIAGGGGGSYLATSLLGAANGVASLDASTKVPTGQIPDLSGTYLTAAQKAAASGVASLDGSTKVPTGQIPDLSGTYIPLTQKAAASGVASLDGSGKVPVGQMPVGASGPGWINVKDQGAVGNGTTDDTTAVQAAITALPTQGGTVYFPPGKYLISSTLTGIASAADMIFLGAGGRNSGNAGNAGASRLLFNSTGSNALLDLRSTSGARVENLCLEHTSTSYTGRLIDLRNTSGSDTAYPLVANCYLAGPSGSATAIGIDLDKATRVTIRECAMYAFATCIAGKSIAANYSNQVRIDSVGFNKSNMAIHNPGQAWVVSSCTFEGSASAVAGAIDHDTGVTCEGLTVIGCWTGDTTSGVQFLLAGTAITFIGNWIGATGGTGVQTDAITNGLLIKGNVFQSCTTAINVFTSGSNSGQEITGNTYNSVTTRFTGTLSNGAIYNDDATAANNVALYAAKINGTMTFGSGNNIAFNTSTGTQIGTSTTQKLAFYGSTAIVKPTVSGAKGSNAALGSLMTALANLGLVVDSTSA